MLFRGMTDRGRCFSVLGFKTSAAAVLLSGLVLVV